MNFIDVFNGDADGICALHQLRLQEPHPEARLISGVKRDITLLEQLTDVSNAVITVLDISLDRNRGSLEEILSRGNRVFYADHHYAGTIPSSDRLTTHLDPEPLTCTSLIVNSLLQGRYSSWAVVGAFGDNLDEPAGQLAKRLDFNKEETEQLKETGILLNYNGYGENLSDLFFRRMSFSAKYSLMLTRLSFIPTLLPCRHFATVTVTIWIKPCPLLQSMKMQAAVYLNCRQSHGHGGWQAFFPTPLPATNQSLPMPC